MGKWVYGFGDGEAEGSAEMRELLGGKGANLAEMASLGLPVPPGFTLTTEICTFFYNNGRTYPEDLGAQVKAALAARGLLPPTMRLPLVEPTDQERDAVEELLAGAGVPAA